MKLTGWPRSLPVAQAPADPLSPQARPAAEGPTPLPARTRGGPGTLPEYLDQRSADQRSVSPATRRMLERATDAMETVRRQIPVRGNVDADNEQTVGEAARRVYATRFTVSAHMGRRLIDLSAQAPPTLRAAVLNTASARVTGAGNCQDFQSAVLIEAGKRLKPGETLVPATDHAGQHAFVQMESKRPDGTVRRAVLDAWSNGPAVLADDCAFAQHDPARLGVRVERPRDARRADRLADKLVRDHNSDPAALERLKQTLDARTQAPPAVPIFEEMHVSGALMVDLTGRRPG
jgi:hypothetical protein